MPVRKNIAFSRHHPLFQCFFFFRLGRKSKHCIASIWPPTYRMAHALIRPFLYFWLRNRVANSNNLHRIGFQHSSLNQISKLSLCLFFMLLYTSYFLCNFIFVIRLSFKTNFSSKCAHNLLKRVNIYELNRKNIWHLRTKKNLQLYPTKNLLLSLIFTIVPSVNCADVTCFHAHAVLSRSSCTLLGLCLPLAK